MAIDFRMSYREWQQTDFEWSLSRSSQAFLACVIFRLINRVSRALITRFLQIRARPYNVTNKINLMRFPRTICMAFYFSLNTKTPSQSAGGGSLRYPTTRS